MVWYFKKNKLNKLPFLFILLLSISSCGNPDESNEIKPGIELMVLGTVQDAGSPQIGCKKKCCAQLLANGLTERMVVSLGAIDHISKTQYLFEATPNLSMQLSNMQRVSGFSSMPDGIFITHAHIGHYTGLMYLGKEAMNGDSIKVYSMDRMGTFLNSNGPWNQLVSNGNIDLHTMRKNKELVLNKRLSITPFLVPHRDEYSETVGFTIKGPNKSALFIPDIDKWSKWEEDIVKEIEKVDYAFIDGTFFSGEEIEHRDISEIPHPFIQESMTLFENLNKVEKAKIYFIHFNHTNPVIDPTSPESKTVTDQGYRIARARDVFEM